MAVAALLLGNGVNAVLFYATGDAAFHTTAPAEELAGSGWQFHGVWGRFTGIPIAPRYFLTAQHVPGIAGDLFEFRGTYYRTVARFDCPASDLRLFRTCERFPEYAPLFAGADEVGRAAIIFGRGTQRGARVEGPGTDGPELKGWQWGQDDSQLRWGENRVANVIDGDALLGGPGIGSLLQLTFDADGGTNECHLSLGDSAGGVFIREGDVWQLAGLNYAVDGPYNATNTGGGFYAALFDQGGLYVQVNNGWDFLVESPEDNPGSFYATRISSNLTWIQETLSQPLPPEEQTLLLGAEAADGPYTAEHEAVIEEGAGIIRVQKPGGTRFFRLQSCSALRIDSVTVEEPGLLFRFH